MQKHSNTERKNLNDEKTFIKQLIDYHYDKYCTFLYYPKVEELIKHNNNKLPKTISKESLSLTNVNVDYLSEHINIKNGVIFVGLNAAERTYKEKESTISDNKFQTMHDTSKNSHDSNTISLIKKYKEKYGEDFTGSFAFDLLQNVESTNLVKMRNVVSDIESLLSNFEYNLKNKLFDMKDTQYISDNSFKENVVKIKLLKNSLKETESKIKNLLIQKYYNENKYNTSYNKSIKAHIYNIKALSNKNDRISKYLLNQLESLKIKEIPNDNLNAKIKYLIKYRNIIVSELHQLKILKKQFQQNLQNQIELHILKYDLPAFNCLMNLYPSVNKIICFGVEAYKLGKLFVKICKLKNVQVIKIDHFSNAENITDRVNNMYKNLHSK
ncbi:hypothetical protein [Apilactobacillus timberlakei]|uniref:hypothetical protein n=1 Tax=Apilactobacillus timberlakei TaxID=2008380 RepID=UPI00112C9932|nr:hypothetical protein [Apilactobacillus timberlakei]TPR16281.1 hypothetical protein DYZ95_07895 [Apilactobacillus timberlakei]TPR21548.1 hypothetical protein DY083_05875 [Apilactobacillus timberlakei]